MIRTSARIALVATVLSLILHVFGVNLSVRLPDGDAGGDAETEAVALGTEFENFADAVSEAVEPEPPVEEPPEPEPADTPTSQALVASPDPQQTATPGTGEAQPVQAEALEPSEPPGETQPSDAAATPPDQTEAAETAAAPPPPAAGEGAPAPAPSPVPSSGAAPQVTASEIPELSEQIAALPAQPSPAVPVAPAPDPAAIPLAPAESETLETEVPEDTIAALPTEEPVTEQDQPPGGSPLAVTASPRPAPRADRTVAEFSGNEPPPILLTESPLVAYARGANQGNWGGRSGSGGAGNASVTNYAGRVLVHLNNAPRPSVRNASGRARVVFVINADGSLASVDIVQSTGNFELDNAAKAQVRNASPFPRPPDGRSRRLSFIYRNR